MVKDLFWPLKVVWLAAAAMVSPFYWATTLALDIIAYFVDRPEAQAVARDELLCPVMFMCAAKMLKCAYLQPWLTEQGLTTTASRVSENAFWGALCWRAGRCGRSGLLDHGGQIPLPVLSATKSAQLNPHAFFTA
jgi:hypothetical protein